MRKPAPPERIGSFLERYFAQRGWRDKLKEHHIWTRWDDIVGPRVSKRSKPLTLYNGVLTIAVETASWLTQLQFMKSALIEKIEQILDVRIKDIRFVVRSSSSENDR